MTSSFRIKEQGKKDSNIKQAGMRTLLHVGVLFSLLFDLEDEGDMFL
jgi:hypothetical protein